MNCYKCGKNVDNDKNVYELDNGEPCCQSCYTSWPEPDVDDEQWKDDQRADEEAEAGRAESSLLQVDEPGL